MVCAAIALTSSHNVWVPFHYIELVGSSTGCDTWLFWPPQLRPPPPTHTHTPTTPPPLPDPTRCPPHTTLHLSAAAQRDANCVAHTLPFTIRLPCPRRTRHNAIHAGQNTFGAPAVVGVPVCRTFYAVYAHAARLRRSYRIDCLCVAPHLCLPTYLLYFCFRRLPLPAPPASHLHAFLLCAWHPFHTRAYMPRGVSYTVPQRSVSMILCLASFPHRTARPSHRCRTCHHCTAAHARTPPHPHTTHCSGSVRCGTDVASTTTTLASRTEEGSHSRWCVADWLGQEAGGAGREGRASQGRWTVWTALRTATTHTHTCRDGHLPWHGGACWPVPPTAPCRPPHHHPRHTTRFTWPPPPRDYDTDVVYSPAAFHHS